MDENQINKSKIAAFPEVKTRQVLRSESFDVIENANPQDIIRLMGEIAKLLNHHIADALGSGLLSCGNPAVAGMSNASSCLEQAAIQFQMILEQQAKARFAPLPPPAQPTPFRAN